MRYLMDCANSKPFREVQTARGRKTLLNKGDWNGYPFWVIGPYDKEGTGGCDRISDIAQVIKLVDEVAWGSHDERGGHTAIVCFEGLLLAHSWGQMGEHLHEKYGARYMNAFIDTSVDQCFANVLKRRKAAGSDNSDRDRVAKIRKNVVADHYRVELAHKRVIARGGQLIDVPYEDSGPFVRDYLSNWVEIQKVLYDKG
jgi:hypothetical protein